MKLEKDRLFAKVDSLEANLSQIYKDSKGDDEGLGEASNFKMESSPTRTHQSMQSGKKLSPVNKASGKILPGKTSHGKFVQMEKKTAISKIDPQNPNLHEEFDPINTHMNPSKTFKGHLMGVTCLAYNPKKDILATGSDDTTWKLWSVPNGDLIMSGEGHQDWIGGVSFHPKGN